MSLDHTPQNDIEKNRIEAAGGRITSDGRVNGGLNLSRAIGTYKTTFSSLVRPSVLLYALHLIGTFATKIDIRMQKIDHKVILTLVMRWY